MKRLVLVLAVSMTLGVCGCANGGGTAQVSADNAANASVSTTQESFKGITLEIPESWAKVDIDQGSLEAASYWAYQGDDDPNAHGGVMVYSETYESFGNTDTQMPDPTDPEQQKIKKVLDLGLKTLDARFFMESILKTTINSRRDTLEID